MGKLVLEERIKYPPFESYRFKPELLPIAVNKQKLVIILQKMMLTRQLEICLHHLGLVVNQHGWLKGDIL